MVAESISCLRYTDIIYILPIKKLRLRVTQESSWDHKANIQRPLAPLVLSDCKGYVCSVDRHEKINYSVTSVPGSCCIVECLDLVPGGKCQRHHHLGPQPQTKNRD